MKHLNSHRPGPHAVRARAALWALAGGSALSSDKAAATAESADDAQTGGDNHDVFPPNGGSNEGDRVPKFARVRSISLARLRTAMLGGALALLTACSPQVAGGEAGTGPSGDAPGPYDDGASSRDDEQPKQAPPKKRQGLGEREQFEAFEGVWVPWELEHGQSIVATGRAKNQDLLVTGRHGGGHTLGKVSLHPNAAPGTGQGNFLARYRFDGGLVFSRFITDGNANCKVLAQASESLAFCNGNDDGAFALGGTPTSDRRITYSARFNATGEHLRTVAFVGAGAQLLTVERSADDGFIMALRATGDRLTLGTPTTAVPLDPTARNNIVIASFDSGGALGWSRRIALKGPGAIGAFDVHHDHTTDQTIVLGWTGGSGPDAAGRPIVLSQGETDAVRHISTAGDDGILMDYWLAIYDGHGALIASRIVRLNAEIDGLLAVNSSTIAVIGNASTSWRVQDGRDIDPNYVTAIDDLGHHPVLVTFDRQLRDGHIDEISLLLPPQDEFVITSMLPDRSGARKVRLFANAREAEDGFGGPTRLVSGRLPTGGDFLQLETLLSFDASASLRPVLEGANESALFFFEPTHRPSEVVHPDGTRRPLDGISAALLSLP